MKTFEEFESNILDMYDELQVVLERLEYEKGASHAEIICVLGNMLCSTARESGVSKENFLQAMEASYLQGAMLPPTETTVH